MLPSLTIHRSAAEIGGNCIEIVACDGQRLLLDAGRPLWARDEPLADLVPPTLDTSRPVAGVLVSHPHLDHWGLLGALPKDWPVWCGPAAAKLMQLSAGLERRQVAQSLHAWQSGQAFPVGPFRVTPLLTDHSAFDAHMLLVEVDGRRMLYSGDFRRHGRKGVLVERLMARPPPDVDVLLVEGTNLGSAKPVSSEDDLTDEFAALFRSTKGRVYVAWSAQNIDRTVTLFKACRRAGRKLALDLYTAEVLHILRDHGRLPQPDANWAGLKVLFTRRLARWLRQRGLGHLIDQWEKSSRAWPRQLRERPGDWVVAVRASLMDDFTDLGLHPTADDAWSFSLWRGYLAQPSGRELQSWFEQAGAASTHVHTSGHASPSDLRAFVAAIAARKVVPIHGEHWDDPANALPNMVRVADGVGLAL